MFHLSLYTQILSELQKQMSIIKPIILQLPCATLHGNTMWFPDKFLLRHLGHMATQIVEVKSQGAINSSRINFISQSAQTLPKKVQIFSFQVCF